MSATIGSLFSGVGGLDRGLESAGLGPTLWQIESDPFARYVLAKDWPDTERHNDVRQVGAATLAPVDVLCGGFPCQDVSAAGKGAGLSGARSGLWREFARIASELRPRVVVVENVASGARRWLPFVRRDLHLLGYGTRAYALSAYDVGAPQMRRRVFVVAYSNDARLEERREQPTWQELSTAERGRLPAVPWSPEPRVLRVAYGVARRVDRIKAIGNLCVPQCAEVIGRIVLDGLRGEP